MIANTSPNPTINLDVATSIPNLESAPRTCVTRRWKPRTQLIDHTLHTVAESLLGHDQGNFVAEAQKKVAKAVTLPPGYRII